VNDAWRNWKQFAERKLFGCPVFQPLKLLLLLAYCFTSCHAHQQRRLYMVRYINNYFKLSPQVFPSPVLRLK